MTGKYALVTGAAGFIGSKVTERLIFSGRPVLALDGFLPNLYSNKEKERRWNKLKQLRDSNLNLMTFDLRSDDFSQLRGLSISSIFHLAAMPGLTSDPKMNNVYYECNLFALNRLLDFAKELELTSFVHASTSSVYGRQARGDESQDLQPISHYGISKLAAEKLLMAYFLEFSLPVKILRFFSVYGPSQRPDMAYAKVISAIHSGDTFRIFGDGSAQRSNTYIDDIVDATLLAEVRGIPGDIINISGSETIALNEAIQTIEGIMDKTLNRCFVGARQGDQALTSGDSSFATSRLGWKPTTLFKDGIRSQITEFLERSKST